MTLLNIPLDFHLHGIGQQDFSDIPNINLLDIESLLAKRKQSAILTLYLQEKYFDNFIELLEEFKHAKNNNQLEHIIGFALEGPLLSNHGGIPEVALWTPSKQQWKKLASLGSHGLVYVIFSPDPKLEVDATNGKHPSITWLTETLLESGVLPAPGHFPTEAPEQSAKFLQTIFDIVKYWGAAPTVTDHFYNDMPHNFKHSWRTTSEKQRQEDELAQLNLASWNIDNIESKLGPVPAVMLRNALAGNVKICMNFDGEHVNLSIVKKTIELVGAENIILMSDSTERGLLAGQVLEKHEDSTLFYQSQGIVAVGSEDVNKQMKHMQEMRLTDREISLISYKVAETVLAKRESFINHKCSVF